MSYLESLDAIGYGRMDMKFSQVTFSVTKYLSWDSISVIWKKKSINFFVKKVLIGPLGRVQTLSCMEVGEKLRILLGLNWAHYDIWHPSTQHWCSQVSTANLSNCRLRYWKRKRNKQQRKRKMMIYSKQILLLTYSKQGSKIQWQTTQQKTQT